MFGPKRIKPLTNEQKTYYNNLGIDLITSGLLGAIFAPLKSNGIDSDSLIEEARQEAFKAVYINPAYFEQHEEMKHEIIEGINRAVAHVVEGGNSIDGLAKLGKGQ